MDLGQQDSSCGSMQSVELICTNGNHIELDHPNIDSCCASLMVNSRADSKTEAEVEETAAAAIDCPKSSIGTYSSTTWLTTEKLTRQQEA